MAGEEDEVRGRILAIDDDPDLLNLLAVGLRRRGHDVVTAPSAERGLQLLEEGRFELVLADVGLPGMSGLEFCATVVEERPSLPVVLITGSESLDTAIAAIRAGAHDYLTKPVSLEAVALRAARAIASVRTAAELARLREMVVGPGGFEGLLGESAAMRQVYDLLLRAAATNASVLITGESGTGKELAARALHTRSKRAEGPFVPVNCSAIPEQLIESELFGHAKGAFTDARTERAGLFAEASGGTLFLDELGELPMVVQPKLLRALEERRIRAVGADREREVDVRFVAATNRDLASMVEENQFREDLYFRVNVIHVHLPPLRSRGGDVLLLARHFLDRFAVQFDKKCDGLSPAAAERMMSYDWPGNVRELRNCVERAVALAREDVLGVEDLPERVRTHARTRLEVAGEDPSEFAPLEEIERRYVLHVVNAVQGNKSLAAKILGLDRKTLHRRMQRWEKG